MRKNFLLGLLITVCSNSYSQLKVSEKLFEGTVEYAISTQSYMQGVSDNELRERIGNTLKVYFKDGNYMREYIDGAGFTIRKMFYSREKNMMYDYYPIQSPDTLYLIDPTEEAYQSYTIEKGVSEKVLDCICPSVIIKAKYLSDFLPDTVHVTMTYFFCEQLPADPEWHNTLYIWKDVIKLYKSISVKFIEEDTMYLKQTFTATAIKWEAIADDKFRIDPKLILKSPLSK